jgi:hypothetical protein
VTVEIYVIQGKSNFSNCHSLKTFQVKILNFNTHNFSSSNNDAMYYVYYSSVVNDVSYQWRFQLNYHLDVRKRERERKYKLLLSKRTISEVESVFKNHFKGNVASGSGKQETKNGIALSFSLLPHRSFFRVKIFSRFQLPAQDSKDRRLVNQLSNDVSFSTRLIDIYVIYSCCCHHHYNVMIIMKMPFWNV